MLLQFSFLKHAPVYVAGKKAAHIGSMLVESERGKVRGFFVTGQKGTIRLEDVVSWDPLTIGSLQQLVPVDNSDDAGGEIFNLIKKPFHPVGLTVHTESGKYMGKVRDYAFDPLTGLIMQIFVEKKVLFFAQRRIIPRSAIIVMTAKGVTVKDDHAFERYSVKKFFQPVRENVSAEGVA